MVSIGNKILVNPLPSPYYLVALRARYLHDRVLLFAVEALPLGRTVDDNMHLVVFPVDGLIVALKTAIQSLAVWDQRNVHWNAIEEDSPYQRTREILSQRRFYIGG